MSRRNILAVSLFAAAVVVMSDNPIAAQRVRPVAMQRKVELALSDDAVIRFKNAPRQFDEKGKPVRLTAEQLKAMKGDPKLPGYAADYADLKPGQIVRVQLGRMKAPKDAGDKKSDKPQWISLGEITARLVKADGQDTSERKRRKDAKDVAQRLVLEVDSVGLAGHGGFATLCSRATHCRNYRPAAATNSPSPGPGQEVTHDQD